MARALPPRTAGTEPVPTGPTSVRVRPGREATKASRPSGLTLFSANSTARSSTALRAAFSASCLRRSASTRERTAAKATSALASCPVVASSLISGVPAGAG